MTHVVGLLGGTFDPIHIGHLCIAESAIRAFGLKQIYFIPAGQPPHKADKRVTAKEHRLNMVRLATHDDWRFEILQLEIDKPTPSYTIETLRELRPRFEERPYFMIGMDSLLTLNSWEGYEEFGQYCQLGVVPRLHPQIKNETDMKEYVKENLPVLEGHIHWIDMPILDISSTHIRNWLENRQSCQYFLPPKVMKYIKSERLYFNF